MVRFNNKELHMLMGALESYEDENNEEDIEIKNEAKLLSHKISWELEQRDMRKDAKDLEKKQKNSKFKFKNYEGEMEYFDTKEEMDEAIKNISSQMDC